MFRVIRERPTAVLVALCVLTRLAYLLAKWDSFTSHGLEYETMSDTLVQTGRLTFNLYGRELPTAYMPPGLIFLLAGIKKVVGPSYPVVLAVVHVSLAVVCLLLVVEVGRRLGQLKVGWLGGALYVADVNLWIPIAWVSETVYASVCILAAVVLAMRLDEHKCKNDSASGLGKAIALGVSLGVGALFRSTLLGHGVMILGWLSWRARRHGGGASTALIVAAAVAMFAVLTPWTLRNWLTLGRLIPVSQNLGHNLWQGWNPESAGSEYRLDGSEMPKPPALMEKVRAAQSEAEIDAIFVREAIHSALDDPIRWLRQRFLSFVFFWHEHNLWAPNSAFRTRLWIALGVINIPFLLVFLVASVFFIRVRRVHDVIVWVLGLHAAIHTLIHADIGSRFRYQIEPLMLIVIAWSFAVVAGLAAPTTAKKRAVAFKY